MYLQQDRHCAKPFVVTTTTNAKCKRTITICDAWFNVTVINIVTKYRAGMLNNKLLALWFESCILFNRFLTRFNS